MKHSAILANRHKEKLAQSKLILDKSKAESRDLTEAERSQVQALHAEAERLAGDIKLHQEAEAAEEAEAAAVARANPHPLAGQASVIEDLSTRRPWTSFGEQLQAIARVTAPPNVNIGGKPGGWIDPRLLPEAAASGMSAGSGADGGFLVQKDRSTILLDKMRESAVLAPRCTRILIGADSDGVELPYIDETSRATGSRWGGVRWYWKGEGDTVTASNPKIGKKQIDLEEMMAICYATERLLRDAAALESVIGNAFVSEGAFKLDDSIIRGTGAGQPLGILDSSNAVTVSVSKETGQNAATILAENVMKMLARLPARSLLRSIWLINQEIWPQLMQLHIKVGTAGIPVFVPGGNIAGAPFGTLLGRPILPIEQAAALGTVGDIILTDLSEYLLIDKGGIEQASSMHVRFIYNEMTFRFNYRANGLPAWHTALTPYKGGSTLSPFVTLATRA